MHFDTKKLTRCALIAAVYVALTLLSNALNLAYGPIQLRFSEAMTVLPFLMPEASWGLFIGCVLCNAILIGALIAWEEAGVGNGFPPAFFYNALTVGAGEAVACYVLGIPLLGMIEKRIKLN